MRKSFLFILSLLMTWSCFATTYTLYGAWDSYTAHEFTKDGAGDFPVCNQQLKSAPDTN